MKIQERDYKSIIELNRVNSQKRKHPFQWNLKTWKRRLKKNRNKKNQEPLIERLARGARGLKYDEFMKSSYWLEVRKLVLSRDKNQCRVCKAETDLQVHHDNYNHHFHEHKHLDDLMTLCGHCHEDYHFNIKGSFQV